MLDDVFYMNCAMAEARRAADEGEIPVGAVVVAPSGRIIGRGHNLTETLGDVTAHAEIQAITAAEASLGGKFLDDCTLYVTLEPCVMCAGAIGWARPSRLVIGCPDPKAGYMRLMPAQAPLHKRTSVTMGVLEQESRELMQEFFRQKR